MSTISLCMIVKNEEAVLARCLESAREAVDEIVVVDTGSSDKTQAIARQFTDRVYTFPWIDDFAAARNFAFSKGSMDFLMWLDADDVLPPDSAAALRRLKETLDDGTDMVLMPYQVAFDGQGNPTLSYYRERLMRRQAGFRWTGAVHEVIPPAGRLRYEPIPVLHQKLKPGEPGRNLRIFEKMRAEGTVFDSRQQFYYARELADNGRDEEAAAELKRFLADENGWVENQIEACRVLSGCLQRLGKEEEAFEALLASFRFDAPRAEICCDLGSVYMRQKDYARAAGWYGIARRLTPSPERGGFCLLDCYGYIPCIQLCVCLDRLGRTAEAEAMNEEAARYKPNDASVLYNRRYFASRKKTS